MLLVFAIAASAAACLASPVAESPTNNKEVAVEELFTHDGCTVYRFFDSGSHYYVRCKGATAPQTMSRVSCGKGCTRDEAIPTLEGQR